MHPTEDAELLRRYADDKSEAAFAELVRRHVDLVHSVALRQVGGDAHLAQDVAQVVFTALARKAPALAKWPVLGGWLYRTTQFAAIDAVRTESRRRAREAEANTMQRLTTNPGAEPDWEKLWPVLDQAMSELNDDDRDAVWLRFFEGRSFGDVGARLRLTENAARMRVERALDKMHALLARRGVTSTTAALGLALGNQAGVAAPAGLAASVTGAALASAGSGASVTVAGVFTFMSMAKITTGIVALLALGAAGFGVYQLGEARRAEASAAEIGRERKALAVEAKQWKERAAQAEQAARESETHGAELEKTVAALKARPAAPAPVPGIAPDEPAAAKIAATTAAKMRLMALRASSPEMQRLMLQEQKAALALRFGPFYRSFGFSAEQVAKFEDLQMEAAQTSFDLAATAGAKGLSLADPAILKLANQMKAKWENDLQGVLGDEGVKDFKQYDRSYGAREAVTTVAGNLMYANAPLTPEQADRLTQVFADSSPAYRGGGRVPSGAQDMDWDAAVARAVDILTPAQLEGLQAFRNQAAARRQAEEFDRNFRGAVAPPATK